jgi:riboflavin kinase/FMN adenylyltransferase
MGSNFRCGYQLDTGAEFIKSMNEAKGIPTEIILPLLDGTDFINSSRIRVAIAQGDVSLAARLLGRKFEVSPSGALIWDLSGNNGE